VVGDYGTLALSELSGEVLSGQRQVLLRREPPKAARSRKSSKSGAGSGSGPALAAADLSEAASGLFESLRAWRAAAAKEQGVPAYVIFHDATLRQIAADAPGSLAELSRVSGVGEAKLERYGQQILDLLGGESD
jgi:ATP-dependent DNA helicase RecQ